MSEATVVAGYRHKKLPKIALSMALSFCFAGCMRTSIRSGQMPGDAANQWEGRWQHAFILGQVERSGPIDPNRICPMGWAQIDVELDPLQTSIAILTLGIYTPTTVTVVCTADEKLPATK